VKHGKGERDVHAERILQQHCGGRFFRDKDWEREAAI